MINFWYTRIYSRRSSDHAKGKGQKAVADHACLTYRLSTHVALSRRRTDGFASDRGVRHDDGMSRVARKDILNLSIAERIELIGDIWDSIAEVPETVAPTAARDRSRELSA
jgi:hypothetical protein